MIPVSQLINFLPFLKFPFGENNSITSKEIFIIIILFLTISTIGEIQLLIYCTSFNPTLLHFDSITFYGYLLLVASCATRVTGPHAWLVKFWPCGDASIVHCNCKKSTSRSKWLKTAKQFIFHVFLVTKQLSTGSFTK